LKKNYTWLIWIVAIAVILGVSYFAYNMRQNDKKEGVSDFYEDLSQGQVESVFGTPGYRFNVILKGTENSGKDPSQYYDYYFFVHAGGPEEVLKKVDQFNTSLPTGFTAVKLSFDNPVTVDYMSVIYYVVIAAVLIALGVIVVRSIRSQNNQAINIGKSSARMSQNVKTRFSDVAGAEEEKEELVEVIDFLKNPRKYTEMGAKIPTGILLVGPPGTGKTLFAKAVAGEAGVPFFSISGSDFVEMYVGVGASRVRSLFDQAKKNMPCIIFIDEIDAVGRQRGAGLGGGNDEREQTLNQLLVELDGFEVNSGIICMAATNRSDILDPALTRPGRFDRQIFVNLPDVRGREAILKVHARNKPLATDVDFKIVARITPGCTGADLANLLNEAAILAVRNNHRFISMSDITEGLEKLSMGPAKRSRLVTEKDKRITAYHESGHAVLGYLLPNCDTVHEVTIIPRGNAGGYTWMRSDDDSGYDSKAKLLDTITMSLGGRIAEELIINDITVGASGDIRQVTEIARRMVTVFGMTEELGTVYLGGEGEVFVGRDYGSTKAISDLTASKIDDEIYKIINECHKKGTELLKDHLNELNVMAKVLVAKETIYEEEVKMIMEGKSFEEICDSIDKKWAKKAEENERRIKEELRRVKGESSDPFDDGGTPAPNSQTGINKEINDPLAKTDSGKTDNSKKVKKDDINIFDHTPTGDM
jgi:cell division protease FtsH